MTFHAAFYFLFFEAFGNATICITLNGTFKEKICEEFKKCVFKVKSKYEKLFSTA